MLADLAKIGEFVYVRGPKLRYGGEYGKGGLGIEPMCHDSQGLMSKAVYMRMFWVLDL